VLDRVQQRSARKNQKRHTGMLILGRHRDARRDSTRGSHKCARYCCPLSTQIDEVFGNPLLQILLVTLEVDQTQVFPSTTLLLSSTGRCQIPKTAVAVGGLLVRPPHDMPSKKVEKNAPFRSPPQDKQRNKHTNLLREKTLCYCRDVSMAWSIRHRARKILISTPSHMRSHSRHLEPSYTRRDNTRDS